jgi:hypothetical protein
LGYVLGDFFTNSSGHTDRNIWFQTVFHNCGCLPLSGQGLADDVVVSGVCPNNCNHLYFAILLFLNILFTFVATMPGLVASLR